jgi:hypothetical protein
MINLYHAKDGVAVARQTFTSGAPVEVRLHRGESWRDAEYDKAAETSSVHQVWCVGNEYKIFSRNIRKHPRVQEDR